MRLMLLLSIFSLNNSFVEMIIDRTALPDKIVTVGDEDDNQREYRIVTVGNDKNQENTGVSA